MSVAKGCSRRKGQRLRSQEQQRQEGGSLSSGQPTTKPARCYLEGSEPGNVASGERSGTRGAIGIAAAHPHRSQRLAFWREESVHGLGERGFCSRFNQVEVTS